jgi:hypothetical protein
LPLIHARNEIISVYPWCILSVNPATSYSLPEAGAKK